MAVDKVQIATLSQFYGLRTDTPASKCPANYSPDCSDMIFSVGGMETRHPFRALATLPAEIVYRKEFTCKDGSVQILALDVNGALYVVHADGSHTQIDSVAPGSSVSSVTAYGREYMSFYRNGLGSDAPRQWDGKNIYRVSQGGPGAPPTVTNYSLPAASLVAGSEGTPVAITSAEPVDPTQVQTGGSDDGGAFNPPQYETYFTSLYLTASSPHGLTDGEVVTILGNTLYNPGATTVSEVVSATEFKVSYLTQNFAIGTGGTVTPSAPFLVRNGNTVTANTATAHGLRTGYQVVISGVPDQSQSITSIVIDNETHPGQATFTTPNPHGFVPGNTVGISGVQNAAVGGSITTWNSNSGVATVTTASDHGLTPGTSVIVQLSAFAAAPRIVESVPSLSSFTFDNGNSPDGSGTGGSVLLPWPLQSGAQFSISAVPSATTFQIPFSFNDGTWTSGSISFAWAGTFYVTSVLSATSFTYRQNGPNALIQSGTGTVTPQGQMPAGDHQVCQHFITAAGFITAPSPPVKFTASGGQYVMVQNLAIGPEDVVARVLSFTGANGSRFFMLLIPGQVNGLQVSTSTRVDDNVTTTALFDFSDLTLLSATAVDVPGNNLFQQTTLNTPRGVRWYNDRLFWIGELNTVIGLLNMGMDGGTISGSTKPLGWTSIGNGVVTQVGSMPALVVTGPDTGEITQPATTSERGNAILQPNLNYSLRFWMLGMGSKVGQMLATISSVVTGFTSTASFDLAGVTESGYYTVDFSEKLPASVPSDLVLSVKFANLTGVVTYRDLQMVYADNPNRNPIARSSYVKNPEAYDALTGNIGPNDDSTELRALFVLDESLHFLTERRLYSVQQIGNSEPSSWVPIQISDKCGAFHAEAVTTGKGWAAWGGKDGSFWYGGGIPEKVSAIIAPTWRKVSTMTNIYDDSDAERVYFGLVDANGAKSMLVYDYHEIGLGGPGKWCPWNRPANWICESENGPVFVFGSKFYKLDSTEGVSDDDLGSIAGYYTFAPIGSTAFQKNYSYLGLSINGAGVMTPFVYAKYLSTLTQALRGQELSTLIDTIAEWPENIRGRLLYLKLGQAGVRYSLEDATAIYQNDPNAPLSGVR